MSAGTDQDLTLGIIIDTLAVTILGVAQLVADIFGEGPQADREIPVGAAQTTVLSRITCPCHTRQQ